MCLGGAGATGAAGTTGTGNFFFKLDIFCATDIFFCWTRGGLPRQRTAIGREHEGSIY